MWKIWVCSIRKDLHVFISYLLPFQLLQSHHDVLAVQEKKNQQRMDRIRHLQKTFSRGSHLELTSHLLSPHNVWWIDVADMLVDLVVAWHCMMWCTWCSSEPGDGFFNNRASTFSCNSKLCSRNSHGLKTCLVTCLWQCTCILVITICRTCCSQYELFPCNNSAFWSDNVYVTVCWCMLDIYIFCCGPSILHMSSSFLQASSLLSSRQPGIICQYPNMLWAFQALQQEK